MGDIYIYIYTRGTRASTRTADRAGGAPWRAGRASGYRRDGAQAQRDLSLVLLLASTLVAGRTPREAVEMGILGASDSVLKDVV